MPHRNHNVLVLGATAYTEVFMDMFSSVSCNCFIGSVENQNQDKCNDTIAGLPILWWPDLETPKNSVRLICALGTSLRKTWLNEAEQRGYGFASLIHPSCVVSFQTNYGAGVSIDAGSVVAGFSTIADHVRIGRNVSIGHHTTIGKFSTLHPSVTVSGNCSLGEQVTIGTGATLIDGVSIGSGAVIAAGALISKNVAENSLVAGNPGKLIKEKYGPR